MTDHAQPGKPPFRGREWYVRKTIMWCLIGLSACVCVIVYSQPYSPPAPSLLTIGRSIQSWPSVDATEVSNLTLEIESILEETRSQIRTELRGFTFANTIDNITNSEIAELVPEEGGRPMRSLVVTTWRSGSTFLGDILNAVPGNYYHYEPLLDFGVVTVRGPPLSDRALTILNSLLTCNYSLLENYLAYGQEHKWLFTHNTRLWEKCIAHPDLCWNPQFLNKFCSLFPFQSMKTVRIRLALLEDLLENPKLGVRVLLLVRDPRGTMQSRSHRDWCPLSPDCYDPFNLCADLLDDYSAAVRFTSRYPNRFKVVRYEDMAVNPYKEAASILNFFGFKFYPSVKKYLDTHTKTDAGGVSSTYRNSKKAPFHWRYELKYTEVLGIQRMCGPALTAWGYALARGQTHLKGFNPVKPTFKLKQ